VESVGFAIRDVLEVMGENALTVAELAVTGGQARSPVWNQIRADITGRPIRVPEVMDAELLGDAIVGLYALGRYPTLASAANSLVRFGREYTPRPELAASYGEMFQLYREAYRGLKQTFARLAHVRFKEDS
jgi:sugar (pentulose or hexulose) kinase